MISFAQNSAKPHQRALKAACLSTLPGLGQLFNRRLDKAIAFFLVDIVNLAFLSVLLGAKIPYVDLNSEQWVQHLSIWRAGTAPFAVVQLMMLAYIVYSQIDAYRDAQKGAKLGQKPELSLSHTTCASYIMHLSAIFGVCFFILVKISPEYHPDLTQISLSFELEPVQADEQKERGKDSNLTEESKLDETAHLKELPKDDLSASSPSAEMSASKEESVDSKPAAEEKEAVASKQIITPDSKQSPKEVSSKGASETAKETTKTANEESKVEKSQAAESETSNPDSAPAEPVKPKLIAQLPASAAAASGVSMHVDESNSANPKTGGAASAEGSAGASQIQGTAVQMMARPSGNLPFPYGGRAVGGAAMTFPAASNIARASAVLVRPIPAADFRTGAAQVGLDSQRTAMMLPVNPGIVAGQVNTAGHPRMGQLAEPPMQDPYASNQGSSGSSTDNQAAPAMLGFMDSTLSGDPDMRQLWSEMSSNISRLVKEHPLEGQGVAVSTFTLNALGQPRAMKMSPAESQLARSLSSALASMPAVVPPAAQQDKMFFQVKASSEGSSTFISLEVSSQPTQITSESFSDFKYQVQLQAYLKGIKKAVYSSWKPPVQEGLKPVMVGFKVSTDGTVSNQHVVQSSGDPKLDKAALNAALSVTKWAQPPAGTAEDLDVCMLIQKCHNCEGGAAKKQAADSGIVGRSTVVDRTSRGTVNIHSREFRSLPRTNFSGGLDSFSGGLDRRKGTQLPGTSPSTIKVDDQF